MGPPERTDRFVQRRQVPPHRPGLQPRPAGAAQQRAVAPVGAALPPAARRQRTGPAGGGHRDGRRTALGDSLSGGETFLISLALALGLASMASSKLRIESLFIDEGFGSLDPESLQLAMDALDNLQAQGRKVAVISHVQEMHERIPVQVRVQREGNGMSSLKVVG
ncbi:SMC family ATPase [Pseudomonas aeruginosa]|nr:SMC family ATPase [Pseudomonas aeruginosa]